MLGSCNKSDIPVGGIDFIISMQISYVDSNGIDLLKNDNPNYINTNSIKLHRQLNGKKVLIAHGPLTDFANDLAISCERPLCFLNISLTDPSDPLKKNELRTDTTYLELNSTITDTIYSEITRIVNITSIKKIWYNGELIYGPEDAVEKYFIMVK